MSVHIISATEASRSFSTILNKVHFQGEHYEIKRGKEIIAKIVPADSKKSVLKISELKNFFKKLPLLEEEDRKDFEKDIDQIREQNKFEDQSWD